MLDFLQRLFGFIEVTTGKDTHIRVAIDRWTKTDLFPGCQGHASYLQTSLAHILQRLFRHQASRRFGGQVKDLGGQTLPHRFHRREQARDGLPHPSRGLDIQSVIGTNGFVDRNRHFPLARAIILIGEFEILDGSVTPGLPGIHLSKPVQVRGDQVVKKGFQFGQRKAAFEGFLFPAVQMIIGQVNAHLIDMPLTGVHIRIAFGLRPMQWIVLLVHMLQAEGGRFDLFDDHGVFIDIKPIDPSSYFQRWVRALDLISDLHFGFIAFRAGALHALMASCAKLGAIAPLEPARGQITRLQYKFHQAADRDAVRLAYFRLRSMIGLHFHPGF